MAYRPWLLLLPAIGMAGGVAIMMYATAAPGAASRPIGSAGDVAHPGPAPAFPVPASSGSAGPAAPLSLDGVEVSVAEYDACVRAGVCKLFVTISEPSMSDSRRHEDSTGCNGARPDRADWRMNCVAWDDADAYCRWVGKRLPTEREWTAAIPALQESRGDAWQLDASRAKRPEDWARSEWTATAEGPWVHSAAEAVRRTCQSKLPRVDPLRWRGGCYWQVKSTREWQLGFRCAR